MADSQNPSLNFDSAQLADVNHGATHVFDLVKDGAGPALSIFIFVLLVTVSSLFAKKIKGRAFSFSINTWPAGLRVALLPLLTSFALTHLFSAASVYYNTRVTNPTTLSYFQNLGVGRLFSLSHAHLFAHAVMYFLVATLVQLASQNFTATVVLPVVALWAGVFDVISWWGMKQVSENFEYLSALTGTAFSVSFIVMSAVILKAALSQNKSEN